MVKPVDDRGPAPPPMNPAPPGPGISAPRHPYGNYRQRTPDGRWYFEWTPFTPAVKAWQNAQWHLQQARNRLADARKVDGFVISEVEQDYEAYMNDVKVLTDEVDKAHRESGQVVLVLEAAHRDYANAYDASADEYSRIRRTVDAALADQGRPVGARKPRPKPDDGGVPFIPWF